MEKTIQVRVIKEFSDLRTPSAKYGMVGEISGIAEGFIVARFPFPFHDNSNVEWLTHGDCTDFMRLKYKPGEIDLVDERDRPNYNFLLNLIGPNYGVVTAQDQPINPDLKHDDCISSCGLSLEDAQIFQEKLAGNYGPSCVVRLVPEFYTLKMEEFNQTGNDERSMSVEAEDTSCHVSKAFNDAINFALDKAGLEGLTFLRLWREGSWQEIREEFPEFNLASSVIGGNLER